MLPNNPQAHYDEVAYAASYAFLVNVVQTRQATQQVIAQLGLTAAGFVSGYLDFTFATQDNHFRPPDRGAIYTMLLESAQQMAMMPQVIGGSVEGGVPAIARFLITNRHVTPSVYTGDPCQVVLDYGHDTANWPAVMRDIKQHLAPRGRVRQVQNGLWPRYCRSIISIADWLCRPPRVTAADFYDWLDNEITGASAPIAATATAQTMFAWLDAHDPTYQRRFHLANSFRRGQPNHMDGISFAIACNFLKEIGYCVYGKPDTILRQFFILLTLCANPNDDECLLRGIIRTARSNSVMPFAVDKLFWLIGTGNFHYHNVNLGPLTGQFQAIVMPQLPAPIQPPVCP